MKSSIAHHWLDGDEILEVPKIYRKLLEQHREEIAQLSPWRAFWFRRALWIKAKRSVYSRV